MVLCLSGSRHAAPALTFVSSETLKKGKKSDNAPSPSQADTKIYTNPVNSMPSQKVLPSFPKILPYSLHLERINLYAVGLKNGEAFLFFDTTSIYFEGVAYCCFMATGIKLPPQITKM